MKHDVLRQAAEYTKRHHRRKRWQTVVTCLAAVVVSCTTYALILPAITMEKQCEIPEHTHSDDCYTQVTTVDKKVSVCTAESLNIHQHTESCYDSDHELVCGYADFVIHQHDSSCYDADGNLWCPLPEIKTHTHDESCWTIPETEAPHEHTDECYEWKQGETLVCGQEERGGHTHSEEAGCYLVESTLTCEATESDGHQHEESCYDENGVLICGQAQGEGGHTHGDGCFQVTKTQTCEIPEDPGHQHTSDCYEKVKGGCICTEPTQTETVEPVLTCEKTEIIPHEHTADCYAKDENGDPTDVLICGQTQILEHQHTDACFTTTQESVDTTTLTCGKTPGEGAHVHGEGCYDENGELICQIEESAGHQHSALCYGTWELTCGMEEHTHTEECQPTEEEQPDEPVPSGDFEAIMNRLTYLNDHREELVTGYDDCQLMSDRMKLAYGAAFEEDTLLVSTEEIRQIDEAFDEIEAYLQDAFDYYIIDTSGGTASASAGFYTSRSRAVQMLSDDEPGSPEDANGIHVDKTVAATDNPNSFLLTLEAYVTGETVTTSITRPADIVFVLDQSGSMFSPMGTSGFLEKDKTLYTKENAPDAVSYSTEQLMDTQDKTRETGKYMGYYLAQSQIPNSDGVYPQYILQYVKGDNGWYWLFRRIPDTTTCNWDTGASNANGIDLTYKSLNDTGTNHYVYYQTQSASLHDAMIDLTTSLKNSTVEHRIALVGFAGWNNSCLYLGGKQYWYQDVDH